MIDLAQVGAGLADPVFDSQRIFRGCLDALSRPGLPVDLAAGPDRVPGLHAASGALLLALLDQDTRLWLSPSLAGGPVPSSLRFHTGCTLADSPQAADYALVAAPGELPALDSFAAGTDEHPERSATVVVQVSELAAGDGWRLSGPGIRDRARLRVAGLGAGFVAQWESSRTRFPRGVDLYFASGTRLCGLPRTTRIEG